MAAQETDQNATEILTDRPIDKVRGAFSRLTEQQKLLLAVGTAAIIALITWGALASRQPEFKTVFTNLTERDGGAIITALEQLNVPYKFSDGTGAIQVPSSRVHEIRLRLASQGLPKGGSVGFELMENAKFGASQFAEQVNYQRALEGELAKTIQSIAAIQAARVHLAIPKPSVFIREEQKPTASVLLNLYPGRSLEATQVAGISHLVASSVPQMPLSNVSVIDQNGKLLSELKSKLTEAGLDPTQIKYMHEVQDEIVRRIEGILAPIVGSKNVRVQVAADIDFSQSEQTAETYRPNGAPPNISIRSQQSSETANVNQNPTGGIPGALSNQAPTTATAPLSAGGNLGGPANSKNPFGLQTQAGQINAAGVNSQIPYLGQPPLSARKDSTINYEIDKTIRYTKQAMGTLKRLSAAVVVNHRPETDSKSGKTEQRPLNEAELKQINDLVKEAMGFSPDRGDTLSVANAPFTIEKPEELNIPIWKDPDVIDLAKEIAKYLIVIGGIAFLLIVIVKPTVEVMFPPPIPEPDEDEGGFDNDGQWMPTGEAQADGTPRFKFVTNEQSGEEEVIDLGIPDSGRVQAIYEKKVEATRGAAAKDPQAVAGIIRAWLGVDG
jgi:flagellar M-ring protein FliF